jgi:hypothetical protein
MVPLSILMFFMPTSREIAKRALESGLRREIEAEDEKTEEEETAKRQKTSFKDSIMTLLRNPIYMLLSLGYTAYTVRSMDNKMDRHTQREIQRLRRAAGGGNRLRVGSSRSARCRSGRASIS